MQYTVISDEGNIPKKNKIKQNKTSAAALDLGHLKVEVADYHFPNCSYNLNKTCQYPRLIM